MDKDHANSIAISKIMDKLNIQPKHVGKTRASYSSPFAHQQPASFWVYFKNNEWYDYGVSDGGKLTEFAERYLKITGENHTQADVLRWIENLSDDPYSSSRLAGQSNISNNDEPVLVIRSIDRIRFIGLIRYLQGRGIPLPLAKKYMNEIKVYNNNTGKIFLALGIKNENDGFELHNPLFNGYIQPRTITFIRGSKPHPQGIHIFKDVFDYISVLNQLDYISWEHDTILLNAISCTQLAAPYVQNYSYKTMYSWMDNDLSGQRATGIINSFTKSQPDLVHLKMNKVYEGFRSVNDWHRHKNNLAL
jgi:hypothetical protein